MARSPRPSPDRQKRASGALPSASEIIAFIRESPSAVGKREIARAFNLNPSERPALRDMLRQIERSGAVSRAANRRLTGGMQLPELTVVEGVGADSDGVPLVSPVAWPGPDSAPLLRLAEAGGETLPIGTRAAARLVTLDNGEIEARIIRRLDPGGERVVGVYERDREGGRYSAGRSPQQGRVPGGPTRRRRRSGRRTGRRRGAAEGPLWFAARTRSSNGSGARPIPAQSACWRSLRLTFRPSSRPRRSPKPRPPPRSALPDGSICGICRWSRSMEPMHAISTTRYGPSPIPTGQTQAAGISLSRSPMSPGMSGPAARSTTRRSGAATLSTSPTASCQCCPRHCRTICAR